MALAAIRRKHLVRVSQMIINANKIITLSIMALLLSCAALGQDGDLKPLLVNDLDVYNLKGKVKSIKVDIDRFFSDTLPRDIRIEYEFWSYFVNQNFPVGYCEFNLEGFLTLLDVRTDSLDYGFEKIALENKWLYKFNYDEIEIQDKSQFYGKYIYQFPVYNPYAVYRSRQKVRVRNEPRISNLFDVYEYQIADDSKNIVEEKFIVSPNVRSRILSYEYNDKNQIVRQRFRFSKSPSEFSDPPSYIFFETGLWRRNIICEFPSDVFYSAFEYDGLERLTKFVVFKDEEVIYQENYLYENQESTPNKVNRYIKNLMLNPEHIKSYKSDWFNELGDPVKCQFYEKGFDQEPFRTQFYEYKYDHQNNWIQCDMYLEGGEEKTEQPNMTYRRNIIYYE